MTAILDELAAALRATVDGVARDFGGGWRVVTDEAQPGDPLRPDDAVVWTYQVRVPNSGDAPAVLAQTVAARLAEHGWAMTSRDTASLRGAHFARDGFDVGVMIGRADGGDVVIGGSTPAVERAG